MIELGTTPRRDTECEILSECEVVRQHTLLRVHSKLMKAMPRIAILSEMVSLTVVRLDHLRPFLL